MKTTATEFTTSKGIAASVTLTRLPGCPCGEWTWSAVVRVRGHKAAEGRAYADGRFAAEWGCIPETETAALTKAIRGVATAAQLAYFGAGNFS